MRIALIQQSIVPGDKQANYDRVHAFVSEAVTKSESVPDVIILPELWSTGYALTELNTLASEGGKEEADFLGELARKYNIWFAGGSVAAKLRKGLPTGPRLSTVPVA